MSSSVLLQLPREVRDDIISHLILPGFVYTSSSKPHTEHLHRGLIPAPTFVDTRIFLPCRAPSNVLLVCHQLREECLQYHAMLLNTRQAVPPKVDSSIESVDSWKLAERLGNENDDETERCSDTCMRVTLEVSRPQRNKTGYTQPLRDEVSPRLLGLLPLMNKTKHVKFFVWPGYDWWNGSRPRITQRINGRLRVVDQGLEEGDSSKPDAVTSAISKVLEHLPAIEELQIHVVSYVDAFRRGDLPDKKWENIQYWLDAPVSRTAGRGLRKVTRRLSVAWCAVLNEPFYQQEELRQDVGAIWSVTRKGDMLTPTMAKLAEPSELEDLQHLKVDECFVRYD